MLAALIQEGHDDGDAARFSADGGDDALQVRIVIVGRHGHGFAVHLIANLVSGYVGNDVNVVAADGLIEKSLAFAGAETGAFDGKQEGVKVIAGKGVKVFVVLAEAFAPILQIFIHSLAQSFAAGHCDQTQRANGACFKGLPAGAGQDFAHMNHLHFHYCHYTIPHMRKVFCHGYVKFRVISEEFSFHFLIRMRIRVKIDVS